MNCDVTLPKDGERWGSIDFNCDGCAPCNSMIRRIFIAICHARSIAGAAAVNRRVAWPGRRSLSEGGFESNLRSHFP